MKNLISVFTLFAVISAHAGQDGNGGFGLKCDNKVEILDLYEARKVQHFHVNLGYPSLPVNDKIKIILNRLAKWMPHTAAEYQKMAKSFFFEHGEILGTRIVIVANKEALREGKEPPLDIGNTIVPDRCDIVAMARNFDAAQSPTRKKRAYIFNESWNMADNDSKAILLLHELFFMNGPHGVKSQDVRYVLSHLMSDEFDQMTFQQWNDISSDVLGNEFLGIQYDGRAYFNYRENGLPLNSTGRVYGLNPTAIYLNGVGLTYSPYPYSDERGSSNLSFAEDSTALSGFILPKTNGEIGKNLPVNFSLPILGHLTALVDFSEIKKTDINVFYDPLVKFDENRILQRAEMINGTKIVFKTSNMKQLTATGSIEVLPKQNQVRLTSIKEKLNEIIGGPSSVSVATVLLNESGNIVRVESDSSNVIADFNTYPGPKKTWERTYDGKYHSQISSLDISGDDLLEYYRDANGDVQTYLEIKASELITKPGSFKMCITTTPKGKSRNNEGNRYNYVLLTKAGKKIILPKHTEVTFTVDKNGIPLSIGCEL